MPPVHIAWISSSLSYLCIFSSVTEAQKLFFTVGPTECVSIAAAAHFESYRGTGYTYRFLLIHLGCYVTLRELSSTSLLYHRSESCWIDSIEPA
jgi:hypothetical protein